MHREGQREFVEEQEKKKEVMNTLYRLGESEIRASFDLATLAESRFYRRDIFEEESADSKKDSLHEADHVDGIVDWLNTSEEERRKKLNAEKHSAERLRDRLLQSVHQFTDLAKRVCNISDVTWQEYLADHSQKNKTASGEDAEEERMMHFIKQWNNEAEKLVSDLYLWANNRPEVKKDASVFVKKRTDQILKDLQQKYQKPARLADLIRIKRFDISEFIRARSKISEEEWDRCIENEGQE